MESIKASVIISTYNQPLWLKKVLWGYEVQTNLDFEIVVADDGSTEETKAVIDEFKSNSNLKISHVWQEDDGFQKTKILNKAVLRTSSDYVIFTDGDCIPRKDFVDVHLNLRQPNHVLSGGYFKLPLFISNLIREGDIKKQKCFDLDWLLSNGLKKTFKTNKLTTRKTKSWFLNTFTTTKATFDGMNVSAWKKDILKVNGFDERMQYGGEDREIGERLKNKGCKFVQIRYSAICLHLYHDRPYKNSSDLEKNKEIRKETKRNKSKVTRFGIEKL
ncbi:glycosyltransferase family 2 protein [Winogradskyella sp. A3E31]|uniref:glycosyltransferase family 2 protein n=1 Tax=Winogradskyella sp. A3E31 TaxID=3349637 RepID=UPI00398A5276